MGPCLRRDDADDVAASRITIEAIDRGLVPIRMSNSGS